MKRILFFSLLCVMLFTTGFSQPVFAGTLPAVKKSTAQTYTVSVGAENSKQGVSMMSFFPKKLTIHVGDSVVWIANSHEIHTVTFLAGAALPNFIVPAPAGQASPLMFNPLAAFPAAPADRMYDGTTFANSGIMSKDPGQVKTFRLTFTTAGTFQYVCIVHGMMMSAEIDVMPTTQAVLSPRQARSEANIEMRAAFKTVPSVLAAAQKLVQKPVVNPDGTTTHNVLVGYSSGVVDVMRFFPSRIVVHPGDTVTWTLSAADIAPHTITFLNRNPDPSLVVPVPQPSGPPLLLFNPVILLPSQNVTQGTALNKTDFFNSGLLTPAPQGPTTFSIKVGDITGRVPYICILHDSSGMVGSLLVTKVKTK